MSNFAQAARANRTKALETLRNRPATARKTVSGAASQGNVIPFPGRPRPVESDGQFPTDFGMRLAA